MNVKKKKMKIIINIIPIFSNTFMTHYAYLYL